MTIDENIVTAFLGTIQARGQEALKRMPIWICVSVDNMGHTFTNRNLLFLEAMAHASVQHNMVSHTVGIELGRCEKATA